MPLKVSDMLVCLGFLFVYKKGTTRLRKLPPFV